MAQKRKNKKTDIQSLTFEQALENLSGIVEKIETGQVSLAESLSQYEKGMDLIKYCRKTLLDAEKRIEKIAEEEQEQAESDEDVEDVTEADDAEDDSLF